MGRPSGWRRPERGDAHILLEELLGVGVMGEQMVHIAVGYIGRFGHDLAQLSRELEAGALLVKNPDGFYGHNDPSHRGPGQTHGKPRLVYLYQLLVKILFGPRYSLNHSQSGDSSEGVRPWHL
jgi:hypothetical protein